MTAAPYADASVRHLLQLVADREPAPGGGPVSAVAVSLAAALTAMAARYAADDVDSDPLVARADHLWRRAAQLADDDVCAYSAVLAAQASSREDDPAQRGQRLRTALHGAATVPLEIAELAAETATLAAGQRRAPQRSTQNQP
ncbi:MAG: cyclodeaminase/cyclohydrolase family protein [Sporichthyaceae bacterium]|nr:cyclodeaminase/cyclohydrolase family protein [Sporichthyaceae bacterium]